MLSTFFTLFGLKMALYVAILGLALVRLSTWKKRCATAEAAGLALSKELKMTQDTLIEVGDQAAIWQAKANAQAAKANAAQLEAAQLRIEYEARAQDALTQPVQDQDAIGFLREQAQK